MTFYGIYDTDNEELLIDEQSEGNNNEGTPMLYSSRELAKDAIKDMDMESFGKVVPVKLSFKKPKKKIDKSKNNH